MLIDRLISKMKDTAPIVVGLDPRLAEIPSYTKEEIFSASTRGKTPDCAAEIIFRFNRGSRTSYVDDLGIISRDNLIAFTATQTFV